MFVATLDTLRLRLKLDKPLIENLAFKLHYQFTVAFLLLCSILVCARELLGEHIKCFSDSKDFTEKFGGWINNYCFFTSTFTIRENYDEILTRKGVYSHPGMGTFDPEKHTKLWHSFYQWVPFLLFFQAICFYIPHYIWKKQEGGRIKALVDGLQYAAISGDEDLTLNNALNIPSKTTLDKKLDSIKRDILLRLRINRTWSIWLVAMEVVNLLHVVLQVYIVDRFLSGKFMDLGASVMSFTGWSDKYVNPLTPIFPKVTKCEYHRFGPSGTIINGDLVCVMALNNVHEKIFTAMWFWFLILFIISCLAVMWRAASYLLRTHWSPFSVLMFKKASSAKLEFDLVNRVVQGCNYSDWLFIYYLAKNMNGIAFTKLMKLVAQELEVERLEDHMGRKLGFEPILATQNLGFEPDNKYPL